MNNSSEGYPCGIRSMVAKIEEYFKGKAFKPFELTPELCRWLTYEFLYQVELALTMFVATRRDKAYMK